MSDQKKYFLLGTGLLAAGAALFLLARDKDKVVYDPTRHTVEELRKIIHEIFVDGATLYCQMLNQMR